ncbi:hypothetical protein [Tepidibacter hydrothermalis]
MLGIKKDGTLWSWGKNDNNQLGVEVIKNNYIEKELDE